MAISRSRLPEDVDRGLMAMIMVGGSAKKAHEQLKARGIKIPDRTLRRWRDELHADRYHELQTEYSHRVAARIASEAERLAINYAEAEQEALDLAREKMSLMKPGELAGAARNFAVAKALQVDKVSSPLRGRPTVVTAPQDPDRVLENLAKRLGVNTVVDADSQEIGPAELTPPERP